MTLREFIKYWLPYGIENKLRHQRDKRQGLLPLDGYLEYIDSGQSTEFSDVPYKYRSIITVHGYGYSGSGAVIDLLREFSNVRTLAGNEPQFNKLKVEEDLSEIDFPQVAGGLFDLEHYINSRNIFLNDAVMNRFVRMISHSDIYYRFPETRPAVFKFMHHLINFTLPHLKEKYYNGPQSELTVKGSDIYTLKHLSLKEYRNICRLFIRELFNSIPPIEGKDTLVLDGFLCDLEYDNKRYQEFVPGIKTIVVYRDPRDIYAFAIDKKIEWIPLDADTFIEWIKLSTERFDIHSSDFLVIRFEDLVMQYQHTRDTLIGYLGLEPGMQCKNKMYFDPAISAKNIGIWKNSRVNKGDFDKIHNNLPELCYDK